MAIINNAPANEAIVSNVAEIGEFRIRNSAKAFNILSSGLYANKIRAIIRELSCNAVDSHIAAGKPNTPFDIHLPNQLEPWFSIRDYGTGLTHDQVTNIYTTYFESTKTNSNEFIGALGLGSKSPFSYTDNFTVTAIKDGKKGIYSAFINEQGVPSIALMMTEDTVEPNGVEVKFSVNDYYDFGKFREEARAVYTYFTLRPVVSGNADFKFTEVEYETKDIVPGVHSRLNSRSCVAVMGNISYPIDIPNPDQLGDLRGILSHGGLVMHFGIGELDFQASREGLSYIPQTIEAIKNKLVSVKDALAKVLATEADAIPNLWDRAVFLSSKREHPLWSGAVSKYAADTDLVTWDNSSYGRLSTFKLSVETLAKKYNIQVRGIQRNRGTKNCTNLQAHNECSNKKDNDGRYIYTPTWAIPVEKHSHFIINDTKVGAVERAKYHYRESEQKEFYSRNVFVLDAADRTKPMKTAAFFKAIANPPKDRIFNASSLMEKPRRDSSVGKNVTIMCLSERGYGGYYREKEMVWKDAGKADTFSATETHYYLPLSGFTVQSSYKMYDVKQFYHDLKSCGIDSLSKFTIYGVRKGDIEFIKTQKNWVNIETHIAQIMDKLNANDMMGLVLNALDNKPYMNYNSDIVSNIVESNSPYLKLVSQLKGHEKVSYKDYSLKNLSRMYGTQVNFDPEAFVRKYIDEYVAISKRYPLLEHLRLAANADVVDYINMVDKQKGV